MAGPWDDIMKQLVESHPQQFTSWVLEGAQFQKILKPELRQTLYADSLLQVTINRQEALLHFEFQSSNDAYMSERLLLYNIQASHAYEYLPVYSYVIYLRRGGHVEQPPLIRYFPDGRERIRFYYHSIELWNLSATDLLSIDFNALLPLTLLTKDGKEQAVVEQVIDKLANIGERGLLTLSYTLGGLVFKTQQEHDWFRGRFHMLRDILEESWTYQELKEDAKEAAKQEVEQEIRPRIEQEIRPRIEQEIRPRIEQEIKKVDREQELLRLRTAFTDIVQRRFPKLGRLAKTMSMGIDDSNVLLRLLINVSVAKTPEEAMQYLVAMGDEEN